MPRTVILNIDGDSVKASEAKVVIAEGWLSAIAGDIEGIEKRVRIMIDSDAVIASFYGGGFYVNIFDHREHVVSAIRNEPDIFWQEFFNADNLPCLVTMRKKGNTLYMALAEIDDPETDIEITDGELELAVAGHFDRQLYRVVNNAIHPATGICLVQKRE